MNPFHCISLFLLISALAAAQTPDSSKLPKHDPVAESFLEKDFFPGHTRLVEIDTSLDNLQQYFPGNYPYSLGSANRKLTYEPSSSIGFRSGFEMLDLFGYNRESMKYYRTRTPYTEVFVLFGSKKEQYARVLHTQNITRQWNIAANLLRIRSEGFYQRQNGTDNNISLSSNYTTRSNRYSFLVNGFYTSIKTEENGGIRNDTLYEEYLFVNKKLIAVNLADARTVRGSRGVYMAHYLNFGKRDTAKGDSTAPRRRILPHTSLSYSFGMKGYSFEYFDTDPLSGYYSNVLFDSTYTHDSTHVDEFQHGLALQSLLFNRIKIRAGADQQHIHMGIYHADSLWALDTSFTDRIAHVEAGSSRSDNESGFVWKFEKRFVFSGPNEGDDYYSGTIGYQFRQRNRISLGYASAYHSQPFIYNYYSSNHFWWRNSFDKVTESSLKLSYLDPKHKIKASGEIISITDYVYLDSTASPALSTWRDAVAYYSISLEKNFRLKHFALNSSARWNTLEEAPNASLHLPQLITNNSLFYYGNWFKKAVDVQLGFDITYFTSYYADAYMPALGLYHWQNTKKMGDYPFVDFFFNMKVKHARIFFKTEHLNSGLTGLYYLSPYMPAPDRSFKVGISWSFYD